MRFLLRFAVLCCFTFLLCFALLSCFPALLYYLAVLYCIILCYIISKPTTGRGEGGGDLKELVCRVMDWILFRSVSVCVYSSVYSCVCVA